MRKLFAIAVLMLFASCIDVEDLGGFWEKGTIDSAIEGTWSTSSAPYASSEQWRLVSEGDSYRIDKLKRDGTAEPDSPLVRSLSWQKYTYLMLKERTRNNATLIRYAVREGNVEIYAMKEQAMEWVNKKYPEQQNLKLIESDMLTTLRIQLLDAFVLDMISQIPEEYWAVPQLYKKQAR